MVRQEQFSQLMTAFWITAIVFAMWCSVCDGKEVTGGKTRLNPEVAPAQGWKSLPPISKLPAQAGLEKILPGRNK